MKCRFLSLLVVIFCIVGLTIPVSAAENGTPCLREEMIGYATDEDGNRYEIIGELVDTSTPRSIGGSYSATYAYDVSRVNTADSADSGNASHVYLTVHYILRDGQHYLLTAVSGRWVISDHQASVISSTISYSCHPYENAHNIAVPNDFYRETGFTLFTPDNGTYSAVGATLHLRYLIGNSRTWTFDLQNNVFG